MGKESHSVYTSGCGWPFRAAYQMYPCVRSFRVCFKYVQELRVFYGVEVVSQRLLLSPEIPGNEGKLL